MQKAKYAILLSQSATPSERFASQELLTFFRQATGIELPVVTQVQADEKYFSVGNTPLFAKFGETLDRRELNTDGVRVFTKDGLFGKRKNLRRVRIFESAVWFYRIRGRRNLS